MVTWLSKCDVMLICGGKTAQDMRLIINERNFALGPNISDTLRPYHLNLLE